MNLDENVRDVTVTEFSHKEITQVVVAYLERLTAILRFDVSSDIMLGEEDLTAATFNGRREFFSLNRIVARSSEVLAVMETDYMTADGCVFVVFRIANYHDDAPSSEYESAEWGPHNKALFFTEADTRLRDDGGTGQLDEFFSLSDGAILRLLGL